MHHEYYTDTKHLDAICQAMSLPGFVEESWTQRDGPTLRLLLRPSFHPELCLTLFREEESTHLSVVALAESFWTQEAATRPKKARRLRASEREEVLLPSSAFQEAAGLFSVARLADRRYRVLDGMGCESCLVSRAGVHRLHGNVLSGGATAAYVGKVIALAWSSCSRPGVRKALADAVGYLDIWTDCKLFAWVTWRAWNKVDDPDGANPMAILAAGLYDNTKGVVCDRPVEAVNEKLRRGKLRAFTPSGEPIPRVAWGTKEARPGQRLLFSEADAMKLWPIPGLEEAERRALKKLKHPRRSRKLRTFLDT